MLSCGKGYILGAEHILHNHERSWEGGVDNGSDCNLPGIYFRTYPGVYHVVLTIYLYVCLSVCLSICLPIMGGVISPEVKEKWGAAPRLETKNEKENKHSQEIQCW